MKLTRMVLSRSFSTCWILMVANVGRMGLWGSCKEWAWKFWACVVRYSAIRESVSILKLVLCMARGIRRICGNEWCCLCEVLSVLQVLGMPLGWDRVMTWLYLKLKCWKSSWKQVEYASGTFLYKNGMLVDGSSSFPIRRAEISVFSNKTVILNTTTVLLELL